jgi:hypothetical protein
MPANQVRLDQAYFGGFTKESIGGEKWGIVYTQYVKQLVE